MNAPSIPVLLTSSVVAHDSNVALKNSDARLALIIKSIEEWLKIDPDLHIILCDGSGFDFSTIVRKDFPHASIECLFFENDKQLVATRGRGHGEGEIIRYAIQNSETIRKYQCFAKCTSKLWVRNFKQLLREWNGKLLCKAVFQNPFQLTKSPEWEYIDTRFYICSVDIYNQLFKNAHAAIEVVRGYGLEQCFLAALLHSEIKGILFRTQPIIDGTGGGTGLLYKNSGIRILKEKIKLWRIQNTPRFKPYFSTRSQLH